MTEKGNLWRKVVSIKYGDVDRLVSLFTERLSWVQPLEMYNYIYPKVGRNCFHTFPLSQVMVLPSFFCHDRWCGEVHLKELFPSLYVPPMDRNASIADYREHLSSGYVQASIFVRDGFIDDDNLISFFNELNEANLGDSPLDKMRWDLHTKGDSQLDPFI